MQINPEITLGHIVSILSAVIGIVITVGRLSQKLEDVRGDLRELADDLKAHATEDSRRFDEVARVLYRLQGKVGNGGG